MHGFGADKTELANNKTKNNIFIIFINQRPNKYISIYTIHNFLMGSITGCIKRDIVYET